MGLPSCIRGPPQCPLRYCTTATHARRCHEVPQVSDASDLSRYGNESSVSISPMRLLRTFPDLEALPVIGIAVTLVRDLPTELYDELVKHPYEIQNS